MVLNRLLDLFARYSFGYKLASAWLSWYIHNLYIPILKVFYFGNQLNVDLHLFHAASKLIDSMADHMKEIEALMNHHNSKK